MRRAIMLRNVVGGNLALWPPEYAVERHNWEVAASDILRKNGFQQVVTPHLYKKALQAEFADWFDNPEDHLFQFEVDEKKKELCEYIPLGSKHLLHIQIFRAWPRSYKELPIRYFEIGEYYEGQSVVNLLAIYLTVFCEPKDQEAEDKLEMRVFKEIQIISKNISPHSGEHHRGERESILYVAADNSKKAISLVTGNRRFIYSGANYGVEGV